MTINHLNLNSISVLSDEGGKVDGSEQRQGREHDGEVEPEAKDKRGFPDPLVPAAELAALAGAINSSSSSSSGPQAAQVGGAPPPAAEFLELDSDLGHDAFLVPRALPLLQTRTREFLEAGLEGTLEAERALVGGPTC